jgi:hypothetical protein
MTDALGKTEDRNKEKRKVKQTKQARRHGV